MKKLFLLDGHALVYRAHYAMIKHPLINSKGMNTSAVLGFVRDIWNLMKNQNPSHIGVAFDLPTPTFRHKIYDQYKAQRDAQPEDITFAIPYIMKILEAMNIPVRTMEGYEADDIIGTLAKKAEKKGIDVYMVTSDKDYEQLVSDHIFMYKPPRFGNAATVMGKKEVLEKWGIERVEQVIDVLGLQGDASDNIPGVPGIGPKKAKKYISRFGSVEELLKNLDKLAGKDKENLENNTEQALLSKKLVTIDLNVPIDFEEKDYRMSGFDREKLTALFKELEFKTLAEQILGSQQTTTSRKPTLKPIQAGTQQSLFGESTEPETVVNPQPAYSLVEKNISNVSHQYELTDTVEKRRKLIDRLKKQKIIAFDTETTGLNAMEAQLVGMSFAMKPHEAFYVPVPKDRETVLAILTEFEGIFEDESIKKVGQNIKYDALILKNYGVSLAGQYLDTMIMHYLIAPEQRHNMDYLAKTLLRYQTISYDTVTAKGKINMRQLSPEKVLDYAAEDADITLQLKKELLPRLEKDGLKGLYEKIEEPLIKVLIDMEFAGVKIDKSYLNEYSKELNDRILTFEKQIYEEAGVRFNIASPKQVGEVLFDKMKIPYRWRKTKTGSYSTNEEKLSELAMEHPFVAKILKHRGLKKLKSTYVDAFPLLINPKTGRIHSSFNQALTATGRLSSSNPNMQNIPIRTPEGRKVREAFIPRDENHVIVAADYSQIELRLIAEISGEETMIEAFNQQLDIHRATAAKVYNVPYEQVTKEQRRNAKTVNFSIIYGAGATNLSRQLGIKRTEAKQLIDDYFKQHPGLKKYMEKIVNSAREKGYVETLMGRRRYIRDIDSRNGMARSNAERIAINTPVQGSAADMIKKAMIDIHKSLSDGRYKSQMIMQVHDELVFDVPKEELEALKALVDDKMKNAMPDLKIPIVVDIGVGNNWLEAH